MPGRNFSAPGFFMTSRHAARPVFSFASAHSEQPRCLPEAKAGMKRRPEWRIVCAAPRLRAEDMTGIYSGTSQGIVGP
jgi:hypothetical protein